ncbi:unnamed protein product [Closterium sp. Naga37s-1]|nr:unnamed protein product [Closterium sp. Naga37s-1]
MEASHPLSDGVPAGTHVVRPWAGKGDRDRVGERGGGGGKRGWGWVGVGGGGECGQRTSPLLAPLHPPASPLPLPLAPQPCPSPLPLPLASPVAPPHCPSPMCRDSIPLLERTSSHVFIRLPLRWANPPFRLASRLSPVRQSPFPLPSAPHPLERTSFRLFIRLPPLQCAESHLPASPFQWANSLFPIPPPPLSLASPPPNKLLERTSSALFIHLPPVHPARAALGFMVWAVGAVGGGCGGRWVQWVLAGFMVLPMGAMDVAPVVGAMGGDGCGGSDGGDMGQQQPLPPIVPVASALCTLAVRSGVCIHDPSVPLVSIRIPPLAHIPLSFLPTPPASPSAPPLLTLHPRRHGSPERCLCDAHDANQRLTAAAHVAAVRLDHPHRHPHHIHRSSLPLQNGWTINTTIPTASIVRVSLSKMVRLFNMTYFCRVAAADGKQLDFGENLSREENVWLQHEVSSFLLSLAAESV